MKEAGPEKKKKRVFFPHFFPELHCRSLFSSRSTKPIMSGRGKGGKLKESRLREQTENL